MGKNTSIEWAHHTFNPWWGCEKVSPACTHCYAERESKRFGHPVWGRQAPRRTFGEKHWMEPHKWDLEARAQGRRARVFCASMADVFEAREDLDPWRRKLWDLIELTPCLDWLLLTKRPEQILGMVPRTWLTAPLPNVWYGTTVEDQEWAMRRVGELIQVPARIRFLSCEPLLGPIDLRRSLCNCPWFKPGDFTTTLFGCNYHSVMEDKPIHWVIAGGESGPAARVMHPTWLSMLRDQCLAAGVAFHFKQWGEWLPFPPGYGGFARDKGDKQLRIFEARVDGQTYSREQIREEHGQVYVRVGKKAAGRMFRGRTWDEIPETGKEMTR